MRVCAAPFAGYASDGPPAAAHVRDAELRGGHLGHAAKPMTSNSKLEGRFGKQDFVYVGADDIYLCPAGERLSYRYTNEEDGKTLRRYWNRLSGVHGEEQMHKGKERMGGPRIPGGAQLAHGQADQGKV